MPKSLTETLGEGFDALSEPAINTEPVEIGREAPVIEQETQEQIRARDEAGRFAKDEERKTLRLKEGPKRDPKTGGHLAETKPEGGEEAAVKTESVAEVTQPSKTDGKEVIAPPADWNGAAKVSWERLPHDIKKTLSEDYKHVSQAKALAPVLGQFTDRFNQDFGGTPQALTAILNTWKYARQQPVDFVKEFIQQYRLDPSIFGGQQQQADPAQEQVDPVIVSLQQELQQVKGQLQQFAQQPIIAQNAQIDTEIQAFQADPANPYFNDVKPLMASILGAGQAKTLKEAYEMACHANPQIRGQLEAKRVADEQEKRRQAAGRAQSAAVSVNGAPGVARPSTPQHATVLDAVRSAYERAEGRA